MIFAPSSSAYGLLCHMARRNQEVKGGVIRGLSAVYVLHPILLQELTSEISRGDAYFLDLLFRLVLVLVIILYT